MDGTDYFKEREESLVICRTSTDSAGGKRKEKRERTLPAAASVGVQTKR